MTPIEELCARYPVLVERRPAIEAACKALIASYTGGGKLLICGNGGSAADSDHIVGELMKGFLKKRPLPDELRERLRAVDAVLGAEAGARLQGSLPAINLCAGSALSTAFGNDVSAELAFAQATLGYGRPGDVLIGISTSGNSLNVKAALCVARAVGLKTIGLTGHGGGTMAPLCDILVDVPATHTFEVQELHLPVYHCICATVEAHFFS